MSRGGKVEEVTGNATLLEKKYKWIEAAKLYDKALRRADYQDFLGKRARSKASGKY